ncbi:MAG: AmmeMemoRadiSam system protein B [Acidimicrobiia bacterium]|nr:AmmeMemoRadiSam system protein B [Acidimicrobiia bacterium]
MIAAPVLLLAASVVAFSQVHISPMAGRWFPAEKSALTAALDASIEKAALRSGGAPPRPGLAALIAPHAGIQYSGVAAASVYRLIGKPANVIVLGFVHRFPVDGIASPKVSSYRTALGEIEVNQEIVDQLGFIQRDEGALCDHSVENQLPLIQRFVPEAKIVPLYAGALDETGLRAAARKLAKRLQAGDLVIASSDFTHYGDGYQYTPFPKDRSLAARLKDRAVEAFENIGSLETALFDRFLARTGDTICGRDPIRLLMATLTALGGDYYMSTADYYSSGDLSGDHTTSVGYGGLAFYPAASFTVGEAHRTALLRSSRQALDAYLSAKAAPVTEPNPELQHRTGVFVTIRKRGELRGCLGTLSPREAIEATVLDRTLAAARSDPRFPPLSKSEGPVSLEISLLTPLKLIPGWRHYRAGLGAALSLGDKGGLLLPQVAEEMGWNQEQFLENLSVKAGLGPRAYRDPKARLYIFSAQVFGEEPPQRKAAAGSP